MRNADPHGIIVLLYLSYAHVFLAAFLVLYAASKQIEHWRAIHQPAFVAEEARPETVLTKTIRTKLLGDQEAIVVGPRACYIGGQRSK